MNPALFFLVAGLCSSNVSSEMCSKANEAFLKQHGYWQQGEQVSSKLESEAKQRVGRVPAFVVGTAAVALKEKKIRLTTHGKTMYAISVDQNRNALATITWRIF